MNVVFHPVSEQTAQETAQNIARLLVGRPDAVGDEKSGCPQMVGENAGGAVVKRRRQFVYFGEQIPENVGFKNASHPSHYGGQTFQSHSGIHPRILELSQPAVFFPVIFVKNEIPDFHALARHSLGGGGSNINFRRRPAGALVSRRTPEIIRALSQYHPVFWNSYFFIPNPVGIIVKRNVPVAFKNGNRQSFGGNPQNAGCEFISPENRRAFEIAAPAEIPRVIAFNRPERKIAEHFKKSQVRFVAHFVNVGGSEAFLDGNGAARAEIARRVQFAGEIPLELLHSRGR